MVLTRKIALMGYYCVGKTSITDRFVSGNFSDVYSTTVEDMHTKNYTFEGKDYNLRIMDTAGQQECSLFPRSCAYDVDGYILVYSIADRRSFEIIQTIYDKIREHMGDGQIPIVLVGNKNDLLATRAVKREEGEKLAKQWEAVFLEVSAKELDGSKYHKSYPTIKQVFEKILREIEVSRGNLQRANTTLDKFRKCVLC